MRIGVLGVNYRWANLKQREAFAKVCQEQLALPNCSLVTLNTCNRTEIYFSSFDLPNAHSKLLQFLRNALKGLESHFDQGLYSYFGLDCFTHLCRVTSGLDSAVVAETEILGQVKSAYQTATRKNSLSQELHFLFQKSFKVGKHIRTSLPLGRGIPDLQHAALNAALTTFGSLKTVNLLIVGASDVNKKLLQFFQNKNLRGITVTNRTQEVGTRFANSLSLPTIAWNHLSKWHRFDWIIVGTKAQEHLLNYKEIATKTLPKKLVIDLSVPRNVDPHMGKHPNVTLYDIDLLNQNLSIRKELLNTLLLQAEHIVKKESSKHVSRFHAKVKIHTSLAMTG